MTITEPLVVEEVSCGQGRKRGPIRISVLYPLPNTTDSARSEKAAAPGLLTAGFIRQ